MQDHTDAIRILLVDDQSIILDGLEALIAQNDRFAVCGRATNGMEAVTLARQTKPDVILMDISMPEMDGIEATREVKKHLKKTHVLMLTMYNNADFVRELMDAGASGYLLKNTGRAELWEAILTVMNGERYLARPVRDMLNARNAQLAEQGVEPDFHALTKREKEIAKLLVEGRTTQDIATKLFLSASTVETHRKNIHHKLGVHSTAGIVRYAIERGWTQHIM